MENIEVNNKALIDELELELQVAKHDPEYETNWGNMIGTLISQHTLKQIIKQLKQLEQIYNQ